MSIDPTTKLPRFNMSFELGLFLAAKSFGRDRQKRKVALILDGSGYRYRDALSDISGQDIAFHDGDPKKAIRQVRDWLDTCQGGAYSLPGGEHLGNRRLTEFRHSVKIHRHTECFPLRIFRGARRCDEISEKHGVRPERRPQRRFFLRSDLENSMGCLRG